MRVALKQDDMAKFAELAKGQIGQLTGVDQRTGKPFPHDDGTHGGDETPLGQATGGGASLGAEGGATDSAEQ